MTEKEFNFEIDDIVGTYSVNINLNETNTLLSRDYSISIEVSDPGLSYWEEMRRVGVFQEKVLEEKAKEEKKKKKAEAKAKAAFEFDWSRLDKNSQAENAFSFLKFVDGVPVVETKKEEPLPI